jgi:penicillin-binding protein 1A
LILRFLGFLFATGSIVALIAAAGIGYFVWANTRDLPDYSQLQDYEPPVMTRVHAADGELLAEYARERRLYLPIQVVPKRLIQAFLSAEDKNFYTHAGVDPEGVIRAMVVNFQNRGSNRRPQGASTITQQVAKNFLLTNEASYMRKFREAILAMRIEQAYSKDKILELYLNEIYLGMSNYGIAAAALNYFRKSVGELTIDEGAQQLPPVPPDPGRSRPAQLGDPADGGERLHHEGAGRRGHQQAAGRRSSPHRWGADDRRVLLRRRSSSRTGGTLRREEAL